MRLQYFTAICGSPIVNLGRTGLDGKMLHGAPMYGSTCLNSMMLHGASWYGSATCAPLEVDPCTSWLHQRIYIVCSYLICFRRSGFDNCRGYRSPGRRFHRLKSSLHGISVRRRQVRRGALHLHVRHECCRGSRGIRRRDHLSRRGCAALDGCRRDRRDGSCASLMHLHDTNGLGRG
ncbi:hypothetical protein BU14_0056s0001 [Porphyra umbilicalis]|uniref:Uncharacterized protein n=1 Tax=Porphyra umbilicalis TaxID=2786 RepID=A0A1X6PHL6_PORUM|nr:hypothetical protein BU14_0056s0001 [Porphyra umbilicalis]|eukprot:OSX80218.1 hypothetical protein BU14_0056s0001 [Porphyra umbilicalis]